MATIASTSREGAGAGGGWVGLAGVGTEKARVGTYGEITERPR